MFDYFGYFNPVINHRKRRVLRQHLPLFEFLMNAAQAWRNWMPRPAQREALTQAALEEWFTK